MKILRSALFVIAISMTAWSCQNSPNPDNELPTLKIGKTIDERAQDVIGSSSFKRRDKTFSYLLFNHKKFGVANLTMRFYKLEGEGKRTLTSTEVNLDPESNVLYNTIDLYKIYSEFGVGEFLMQFLNKDIELASAKFELH